jgi:hypothetical protein
MRFLNQLGMYAAILGALAIVMNYFNMVPRLLMWIYYWGDDNAMIIKISLIVGGGLLWFFTRPKHEELASSDDEPA